MDRLQFIASQTVGHHFVTEQAHKMWFSKLKTLPEFHSEWVTGLRLVPKAPTTTSSGIRRYRRLFFCHLQDSFSYSRSKFIYLLLAVLGLHCCVRAFSSFGEQGLLSGCGVRAARCSGFSRCSARALGTWASVVEAQGLMRCGSLDLEHTGFSICGARAQ